MENNVKSGSLVWLRRDLRLEDNKAIEKALNIDNSITLCFVFDKEILNPLLSEPLAIRDSNNLLMDRRISFIYHSLRELDLQLKEMGSLLIVKYGFSSEIIPELVKKLNIKNLVCSSDYEPSAISRDLKIKNIIKENGVNFISVKDQCIFEKKEILSKSNTPYTVFTPYKNSWMKKFFLMGSLDSNYKKKDLSQKILQFTKNENFLLPSFQEMGFSNENSLPLEIKCGSSGARFHLKKFLNIINSYKLNRDFPALSGTSHLSIHLRFGTISIRMLIKEVLGKNQETLTEGSETWLSELVWREFYMQILFNFPHVSKGCFKKHYDSIKWISSDLLFEKWRQGSTGYPIIDAGMRQLNQTGFMHNRLRMLTASFLTKDLGIDWQKGEKYFALKLNDFDLSANNGGWQWAASTGCDAQPYFRIFNPITQSKKFDPEGKYIKKFIPELNNLSSKYIHTPWLAPNHILKEAGIIIGLDYPNPSVEHSSARVSTLKRYNEAKN